MVNRPNPLPGTRLKPSQLSSYRRASAIARRTYSCAPDRSIQSRAVPPRLTAPPQGFPTAKRCGPKRAGLRHEQLRSAAAHGGSTAEGLFAGRALPAAAYTESSAAGRWGGRLGFD